MNENINPQWLLHERPQGAVTEENFLYREVPIPEPDLDAGQILVRNEWFSFDPAMRTWMDERPTYLPPSPLGEPMRAVSLAQVEKSTNPDYPAGAFVQGMFGWQRYAVAGPGTEFLPMPVADGLSPEHALGACGGTGATAWTGMLRIAKVCEGETVVVSAAAGATGSVAAQLARLQGCRVIGIAGSEEKCEWLLRECRLDAVLNYRREEPLSRLAELCPDGIDVFFDNVGGAILEAAVDNIAQGGRIVLCGQIAAYNEPVPGPSNLVRLVLQEAKMEGFLLSSYLDTMPEAIVQLRQWLEADEIRVRYDIQHGFENIPRTLLRVFSGENQGKQLLQL